MNKPLSDEEVFGTSVDASRPMSDDEVFGKAAAPSVPLPRPRPTFQERFSAAAKPDAAMPPVQPLDDATPPPPPQHSAITRGFMSGLMEQNPQMASEALEGVSHLAPEQFRESLLSGSRDFANLAKRSPSEYKTESKGLWNIEGIGDALTWAGETLGQGVASSVPSLVTGIGGGIVGSRVAGKTGAVVGGLGGATVPSAAMNYGEVYKALKDEKVDPKEAAYYAGLATGPITALDMASLGSIVGKVGLQTVRSELNKAVAKRIAVEVAKGGGTEGVTEALQEVIKDATVSLKAGKPFWTMETAKGVIEAGAGGALPGMAFGAVAGVSPRPSATLDVGGVPVPTQEPVTPEDIAAQVAAGNIPTAAAPTPPPLPGVPPPIPVAPTTPQGEPPGNQPPPAPPQDVGGATTPLPTNTPVTTITDGVATTTTLHGPSDAYMIDTTGEKPVLVPAPTPPSAAEGAARLEPAIRKYGQEDPSTPVGGLYSRLQEWVRERGPLNATSARWISQLKRGDFRAEELRDLRLPQFLAQATGRVSKDEVIDYITAMAAPMVEVTRTPLTKEAKDAEIARINDRIATAFATEPGAMRNGAPNWNHPVIGALADEITNINRNVKWARYEEYTTPGPRESYTELTIHLPERPVGRIYEPTGSVVTSADGKLYSVVIDGQEQVNFRDKGKAERILQRELEYARKNREQRAAQQTNFVGEHYVTPNEIVTVRMTVRLDENGMQTLLIEELQSDLHQRGKKFGYVPERVLGQEGVSRPSADIPFKEGWAQLGFTRAMMWAAQRGITQIAWADSNEQMRRYPAETAVPLTQKRKGMEKFYDQAVTGYAKRWARRLGGTVMYTTIPGNSPYVINVVDRGPAYGPVYQVMDPMLTGVPMRTFAVQSQAEEFIIANTSREQRFRVLRLPGSALETISQGVPSYSKSQPTIPFEGAGARFEAAQKVSGPTVTAMQPMMDALNGLIKRFGLDLQVTVKLWDGPIQTTEVDPATGKTLTRSWGTTFGLAESYDTTSGQFSRGIIHINVPMHKGAAHIWATMAHELGHIVQRTLYERAPIAVRIAVDAAYAAYKATVTPKTPYRRVIHGYQSPVPAYFDPPLSMREFGSLEQDRQDYWAGFPEFFAEKVATWATTTSKPLALVEKFFAGVAKKITDILEAAKKKFGLPFRGVQELNEFLDSFVETTSERWGHDAHVAAQQAGVVNNAVHMTPGTAAVPPQPATIAATQIVNNAFGGRPPKEVQTHLAYADKFNSLYKWALAIHQLAAKNPHIKALQQYVETVRHAYHVKQQMMTKTEEILKTWNKLGETQSDAVAALLDDIQNMSYRTPAEVTARVARHPTQTELVTLAQKHGVNRAGLAVVGQVGNSFQEFLNLYEKVLIDEANKISDPTRQQLKLAAITKQMRALRSKPYFPSIRFGVYTLTIRDAAKKVIHFETFESKRQRQQAANAIHQKYGVATSDMQLGLLNKEAKPLLGVPTQLLDLIEDKLNLSPTQRDAIEQLKFELSPAQSFQHRFQHKKRVAGYSMDFRRAYAHYFFHGANHMMKAQYADRLRALMKMTIDEVKQAPDVTKREGIEAFISHHLDGWLDPKPDWAAVSSVAFMFGLAFSPMAAMMNLTQTMHTTYPHLAHYFGDASAVRALANVGRKFQTFYTKGKLDQTAFETKAIFQGIEDGIIKETMAAEIAGIADGNVLSRGYGGNYIQRGWTKFNEAGSFLFEMAEQVNRRLAFRAALQLAQEQPNSKYVKDAVTRHNLTYKQRKDEGWTDAEATAYVVAVDTTLATQFQYGKQFAPRIFQGRKRSIFVFKTFVQSYLVFLTQNKGITIRSLLVMAAMGGLMGMPFADDLEDMIEMLAWRMFGKDFSPSKEVRKWILEISSTSESGDMWAEWALHGIARKGFGIPWIMDMLGGTLGVDVPAPTFDVSRSVGMGQILPVQVGKMFGPPLQSPEKNIAEQAQRASGAVFGIGFAAYKALVNSQLDWNDAKRWEGMMPRAAASVSKALRAYREEGMRTNTGGQIVKYDVRDNEQMAEVIGMAMGFTPYRQNYEWEKVMSKRDAEKVWDIRREDLMRQFSNTVIGKDKSEKGNVLEAIRTFNRELPSEARGKAITSDSLEKSVETRARNRALEERGLPRKTSSVPIFRREDELYPRSMREINRVKPSLTP